MSIAENKKQKLRWMFILAQLYQAKGLDEKAIAMYTKVAHSNEGFMAFLVVIVWHIWNAHLAPEVFPFDRSIFTGQVSMEKMHHEHPLELERSHHR